MAECASPVLSAGSFLDMLGVTACYPSSSQEMQDDLTMLSGAWEDLIPDWASTPSGAMTTSTMMYPVYDFDGSVFPVRSSCMYSATPTTVNAHSSEDGSPGSSPDVTPARTSAFSPVCGYRLSPISSAESSPSGSSVLSNSPTADGSSPCSTDSMTSPQGGASSSSSSGIFSSPDVDMYALDTEPVSPSASFLNDSVMTSLATEPAVKPVKPVVKAKKPTDTYIALIAKAILSTKEKKIAIVDMYDYITENYPYYRQAESSPGSTWKNAIRHNLSANECFIKNGRTHAGRGYYWSIHPACVDDFQKGQFNRRDARRKAKAADQRRQQKAAAATPSACAATSVPMSSQTASVQLVQIPGGFAHVVAATPMTNGSYTYVPYHTMSAFSHVSNTATLG